MKFANRTIAGQQLAQKLDQFLSSQFNLAYRSNLLVVGLPRGGLPVALEVARQLGCPLEIIVAKKLPFPGQPEYAIGAVSSDGVIFMDPSIPKDLRWQSYVKEQQQSLLERTKKIEEEFHELAGHNKISFKGKNVILVDDGIATGMTAFAAIGSAKLRGASCTIMAAPVMSRDSYRQLQDYCDEVVAISVPEHFVSVGQHYLNFDQTSDEEVVQSLKDSAIFGIQPGVSKEESRVPNF